MYAGGGRASGSSTSIACIVDGLSTGVLGIGVSLSSAAKAGAGAGAAGAGAAGAAAVAAGCVAAVVAFRTVGGTFRAGAGAGSWTARVVSTQAGVVAGCTAAVESGALALARRGVVALFARSARAATSAYVRGDMPRGGVVVLVGVPGTCPGVFGGVGVDGTRIIGVVLSPEEGRVASPEPSWPQRGLFFLDMGQGMLVISCGVAGC